MTKYTQKQLRAMVRDGIAIDMTNAHIDDRKKLVDEEEYYTQIGYAAGIYGCNGKLLQGKKTGQLYAITGRTQAIYIF